MKIAVMGAGGVGGYYGAVLARGGEDVTFIARGNHLAAMKQSGLKVESPTAGDFALPKVKATDVPADVGKVDLILMATKTFDLENASAAIKPMIGPETAILPLLNGVDIADRIAGVVGKQHVLGGMCQISSMIKEPGVIRMVSPFTKIVFGELGGGNSPRVERIQASLKKSGLDADISQQVVVDIWNKFLLISAIGGTCALTGALAGEVRADPDTRAVLQAVMEEIFQLSLKMKVPLKPTLVADTMAFVDKMPPHMRPSMLLSVEQGAKLEVDALNGAAAALGKKLGVPTPVNQFIFAALKLRADGKKA